MLRKDIEETLGDIWNDGSEAAKENFVVAMEGRQYGREALVSAYLWFLHGWNDAMRDLTVT